MDKPVTKKIIINGRFLTQGLTGVQRVAGEIVHALDNLLTEGRLPPDLQQAKWILLTPRHPAHRLSLRAITIEETGSFRGHLWEQIDLFRASRNHTLLNFCNSGPVLHPRQFVMIHDACVYRHPEFFGKAYRLLHQSLGKCLARNALIGTVSHFSQRELSQLLKIPLQNIGVFYNGVDHMHRNQPDMTIIERLNLANTPYFLCLGSLTKNKNVQLAVDALARLDNKALRLVIVGGGNKKVFGNEERPDMNGVIFAGRLSDAEIAGLLSKARAFIFPSIYEGFGLPPLEAMTLGCPVLASTAEAVMEVCGDTIHTFDAKDSVTLANLMRQIIDAPIDHMALQQKWKAHLDIFTWEKSALGIAHFIHEQGLA